VACGLHVPCCPAAASGPRDTLRHADSDGLGHAARAERFGRAAPVPGPVPAPGPAAATRARPQDPPRPAGQVQGRTRGDPARSGSCGILRADGALPAVPPNRARPQVLEFVSEVRRKQHEARAGVLAERKALEEAAEHRELMAWNRAENQRLQELRIARLRQEAREQEQRRAEEKARQAREAQAWAQLKEQEVLQLQEEAKTFITRENLEARVQEALDSPKSYNWAITREGLVVRPKHKGS
uniref:Small ribosomal subunit protein mS26 n=1 Tax=Equus caballus TaxID=9796 RepID=F6UZJ4_HORSE